MAQFKPFEIDGVPMEEQFMSWNEMVKDPYNKRSVDAYTRTRVILMNGIENNAVLTSHAMERMIGEPEIKRKLAMIRRADSQQQQTVNWLNPADQSVLETTIGYEQTAVDLTANLAKNESDPYVKSVLDYALIEDFDHLYRYGCLLEVLEGNDPDSITQGKTEAKPGRPTSIEHRHPDESMRKHYDKDFADIKTKMNYITIVSGEQQTELFYKSHGFMYPEDLARKLYAEIAEIEEQHVTQYGLLGDPRETMLEKMALIQLSEAYNYFSCAETETEPRIKRIWELFAKMEITHFSICNDLLQKYEKRDMREVMQTDVIEPLIVFESNKDYVNRIVEKQTDLMPHNMIFERLSDLPDDWATFGYQRVVNGGGVPSEDVVYTVQQVGGEMAKLDQAGSIRRVKQEMARRAQIELAAASSR